MKRIIPGILFLALVIIAANACRSQVDDFLLPIELTGPYEGYVEVWRCDTDSSIQFIMKNDGMYSRTVQNLHRTFQVWSTDSTGDVTAYGFHMNDLWSITLDEQGEYLSEPFVSSVMFFWDNRSGLQWLEFTDINGHVSSKHYLLK